MAKQYSSKEAQIVALEIKMARMISSNAPMKQIFAINGLIKKLKKEQQEKNHNDWLGQ